MAQPALAPLPSSTLKPRNNLLALVLAMVIFASLSLWMAIASKGFLEMDAQTHYMFARHALDEPDYLINIWGRPLCTALNAIPAAVGGVLGVRVMSLILALLTGLITYRIARGQNHRLPALAAICLFAMPLYYLHSFSEMTEVPFAFAAVLAFWAYQSRRFLLMTLIVSITPAGRPEGFFLEALAALALIGHRRWYYVLILPLPLLLWSYLGWKSWGGPPDQHWYLWLKRNWPYAMRSAYGSGRWFDFVMKLPVLLSPLIFPAFFIGVALSVRPALRRAGGRLPRFFTDHVVRCQFIIAFIPLTILIVHSILWRFGLMASSGDLRYLLCVAPFWALLCAKGWEWVWDRFRLPAPFLFAALAASAPIYANLYYQVVPLRIYDSDYLGQIVADWYIKTPGLKAEYPRVMASLPSIYYALDISQSNPKIGAQWGRENVAKTPDGVILIWDQNALANASRDMIVTREQVDAAGWIWLGNFFYGDVGCKVYLSPKTIEGKPTDPDRFQTPGIVE